MRKSKEEEKWFQERERRLLEQRRRQTERERDNAEAKELRELHWMRCPKCGNALETRDLRGVAVDVCSVCAGLWLDQGELEAIEGESQGFFSALVRAVMPRRTTRLGERVAAEEEVESR